MLFKTIAIVLSTLFIAAVQLSTAHAGCGGGHGYGKTSLYKKQAAKQSRARRLAQKRATAKKRQARLARAQKAKEARQAAAEKAAETPVEKVAETTTETENTEQKVAAAVETCTRFIAQTGTTVSLPCSTE